MGKGLALAAGGLFIVLFTAISILNWTFFSNLTGKTIGTVTGIFEKHSSKNNIRYPVVKFTASDGKTYSYTSTVSNDFIYVYSPGDAIKVKYNKKNPVEADTDSIKPVIYLMGFAIFGVGILAAGIKCIMDSRVTAD